MVLSVRIDFILFVVIIISQNAFTPEHGGRANVPHIIIHVSNKPSANPVNLLQAAQTARDQGVVIFNVGVGEGTMLDQLAKVCDTGTPHRRLTFSGALFLLLSNNYTEIILTLSIGA
jgi:hypothetical protein